jgi:hypothetical protein
MLVDTGRIIVSVSWFDRDNNEAETRLYGDSDVALASIEAGVNLFVDRVQPLSSAWPGRWFVRYTFEDDGLSTAVEDSDVLRRLAMFYRTGEVHDRIWVPSGRLELMETVGTYAGIRLDALRPEVAAILLAMQDVTSFIVTPEGDSFPSTFVVGGLAL